MSENLELCPKCKQGHLRDAGGVTIKREIEPRLRQTGSSIRERICDQCGHRQVDQYLNEYGEPASDMLSGTVTKQNQGGVEEKLFTCDCGVSFKTDKELHEHHQSEHGGPASDKITGTVTRIDPQDKTEE